MPGRCGDGSGLDPHRHSSNQDSCHNLVTSHGTVQLSRHNCPKIDERHPAAHQTNSGDPIPSRAAVFCASSRATPAGADFPTSSTRHPARNSSPLQTVCARRDRNKPARRVPDAPGGKQRVGGAVKPPAGGSRRCVPARRRWENTQSRHVLTRPSVNSGAVVPPRAPGRPGSPGTGDRGATYRRCHHGSRTSDGVG